MFNFFGKKKEELDFNSRFIVIELTEPAKNAFINDKYNKKIVLYNNWYSYMNKIPSMTIPYTDQDLRNLIEIYEYPVIEENLDTEFEFGQDTNFGEVVNRIR